MTRVSPRSSSPPASGILTETTCATATSPRRLPLAACCTPPSDSRSSTICRATTASPASTARCSRTVKCPSPPKAAAATSASCLMCSATTASSSARRGSRRSSSTTRRFSPGATRSAWTTSRRCSRNCAIPEKSRKPTTIARPSPGPQRPSTFSPRASKSRWWPTPRRVSPSAPATRTRSAAGRIFLPRSSTSSARACRSGARC